MNLQQYFKSNNHRRANEYTVATSVEPNGGVRLELTPVNTGQKEDVQHFNVVGNHLTHIGENLYQAKPGTESETQDEPPHEDAA